MSKKRLITSALPYVNNEPHLGNIIGCVLSADCYARYSRSSGNETLYICGTDEYGTATETKATQEGLTPREICDKYHEVHKNIYEHFNISFDAFGRTSTDTHTEVVQSMFEEVLANGYLIHKESEQFYSETLGKFLADRLITGTCPKCKYEDARGDQCDGCGSMLTPTELINPVCSLDGSKPVLKETHHLYLDFNGIKDKLEAFQNTAMDEGFWPNNAKTTTQSWMKMELQPRAITRDLKWGVPVPKEGFENKVFYVWFDAPIGYVSITKNAFPATWQDWWQNPENTELYQFMAKDNIPFHSLMFPATQLAHGADWTMVHHLSSTEYLNYEDTKFSKSRNTGVFGTDVINSGIHVDLWRFYLLAVRPERQDTAFSWNDFVTNINKNFINNVGNLVNRSLVFSKDKLGGKIDEPAYAPEHMHFMKEIHDLQADVTDSLEKVGLKEALRLILKISQAGNVFFDKQEPWKKIKEDPTYAATTLSILTHLVKDIAIMIEPFMPETSGRIFKMLNLEPQNWDKLGQFDSLYGHQTEKPEILFKKLDEKIIDNFKEKFSGEKKEDPWSKVELKVGKIVEIDNHPTAEHLYVEKIDLGGDEPVIIASGLVKYFEKEDLLNKHVMVASNLSAAELSGVKSHGMVLAVSKKKKMEVIDCGDAAPGTVITKEGETPVEKPEIDIIAFKEAALRTVDGTVSIDGEPLFAGEQPLKTTLILNGKIG
ncbi:MAG: methionine--tRNA ligase [Lentisphaerales bacterium]|nr:methionine--tRNA ligase [Lentisphaerales bacterium]